MNDQLKSVLRRCYEQFRAALLHGNMKSPVKPITPLFSVSKT